jgi:hypothetical protein
VFRLSNNYKLTELPEFKAFVNGMVAKQANSSTLNTPLIESLISIGQRQEAFKLMENGDPANSIKGDQQIMSLYLNLLCDRNLEKAAKIQKSISIPSPSDLFDQAIVEE